jgi:diaminopimelate epimerase
VTIELDGGELQVEWQEGTDHVLMTGPAATNFTGTLDLSAFGD